jgi:uncharacterized integral membrane protein
LCYNEKGEFDCKKGKSEDVVRSKRMKRFLVLKIIGLVLAILLVLLVAINVIPPKKER